MLRKDIIPALDEMRRHAFGFNSLFDAFDHGLYKLDTFPKANIMKYGDETLIIELALAGFDKDNITVERGDTNIIIKGEKELREYDENVTVLRHDIAARAFEKVIPVAPEYSKINVKFENGLLSINLEKEEVEPKTRLIEIS